MRIQRGTGQATPMRLSRLGLGKNERKYLEGARGALLLYDEDRQIWARELDVGSSNTKLEDV